MTATLRAAAVAAILFCLLAFGLAARLAESAEPPASKDETAAAASARTWLAHVDAERYGESWDTAASLFRMAVTRSQWQEQLGAARAPLGKLQSRKLTASQASSSLPGAPEGHYVVMQWQAIYEHRPAAIEIVTALREQDGEWQVAGYFIR